MNLLRAFAYGLRDHAIFEKPFAIDRSKMVQIETPEAWRDEIDTETVKVLPLVKNLDGSYTDGWCTYTYAHTTPELEEFCGGVNSKTPKAERLSRQGNLLHFGFEQSPSEIEPEWPMALVELDQAHVARFTDDRPIANTPSPFAPAGIRFIARASWNGQLSVARRASVRSSTTCLQTPTPK